MGKDESSALNIFLAISVDTFSEKGGLNMFSFEFLFYFFSGLAHFGAQI